MNKIGRFTRRFKRFRKAYGGSMIRPALAERIICLINTLPRGLNSIILFPILLAGALPSYFSVFPALGGTFSSYSLFLPVFLTLATIVQRDLSSFLFGKLGTQEPIGDEAGISSLADCVENLSGEGPRVAAYLRVSTGKQAKKGFSLDAQRNQLEKLKIDHKPSRIYWFIDAGKSGTDFDKRKLNVIMELKAEGKIDELWVTNVDRIGRECRKLLLFFLNLCNDGVVIRTPEKVYGLKDLSSLLVYVIEAHAAEQKNKDRANAVVAGKAQAFKQGRWNKPMPTAYRKAKDGWLEKIPDPNWEPLINDAYALLLRTRKIEHVRRRINEKYHGFLPKPLARHQIKRILSDPIYMGKPQHLGVIAEDPSLVHVDEKTFVEAQKVLECIHRRHSCKRYDPIKDSVAELGISALDFYDHFVELHHKNCGGLWVKNGTETVNGVTRQIFLCKKCGRQTKIPKNTQMRRIQEWVSKQEKLFHQERESLNSK